LTKKAPKDLNVVLKDNVRLSTFRGCYRRNRMLVVSYLPAFPSANDQKNNQQNENDQEIDNDSCYPAYPDIAFMPLHQLTIIPVLCDTTGTHLLPA
jgi:hypothetical protein